MIVRVSVVVDYGSCSVTQADRMGLSMRHYWAAASTAWQGPQTQFGCNCSGLHDAVFPTDVAVQYTILHLPVAMRKREMCALRVANCTKCGHDAALTQFPGSEEQHHVQFWIIYI